MFSWSGNESRRSSPIASTGRGLRDLRHILRMASQVGSPFEPNHSDEPSTRRWVSGLTVMMVFLFCSCLFIYTHMTKTCCRLLADPSCYLALTLDSFKVLSIFPSRLLGSYLALFNLRSSSAPTNPLPIAPNSGVYLPYLPIQRASWAATIF
jgi:hypothetical protein